MSPQQQPERTNVRTNQEYHPRNRLPQPQGTYNYPCPQVTRNMSVLEEEQRKKGDEEETLSHYTMQPHGATQNFLSDAGTKHMSQHQLRKKRETEAEMNYLYQEGDGMISSQSMQVTIKRVLQEKIFRSVKFLPRNNNRFKYPDFVNGMANKEKTVIIINGVLDKMNLSHYSVAQKTRFWITYGEIFRDFFTQHRSSTQESLKRIFFDNSVGKNRHSCDFTNPLRC